MALVEETKRITAQFDYTDADVNKGVQEFLRQMSKLHDSLLLAASLTYVFFFKMRG